MAHDDGSNVGLARLVFHFDAFVVHAQIVAGHVEQRGLRREGDRLLILAAHRGRADVLGVPRSRRLLLGNLDGPAGLQVNARRPVHRHEGLGHEQFTGRPIQGVREPVAVEVHQDFSHLPANVGIHQDVLVDPVVVPAVMGRLLVRPFRDPGVGIPREDRHRPLVVARTLIGIPRPGVPGAVVQKIQIGIVAVPAPGRAAASFPLVALPGLHGAGEPDLCLGSSAVHPPDLFAGLHVVGGHKTTNAEFSTADAADHLVSDHNRGGGDGLTVLEVALLDLPHFLARFSIQGDGRGIQLILEDLAVGVREAAIHGVAAGNRHDLRILLRRVLPLDGRPFLGEVEGVHDVWKWRVHVHGAANHQRSTLVAAEHPRGKRPGDLQILDVAGVDRIEPAVPRRRVVLVGLVPLLVCRRGIGDCGRGRRRSATGRGRRTRARAGAEHRHDEGRDDEQGKESLHVLAPFWSTIGPELREGVSARARTPLRADAVKDKNVHPIKREKDDETGT